MLSLYLCMSISLLITGVMVRSVPTRSGDSGVTEEAPLRGDDRTRVVCCPSFEHLFKNTIPHFCPITTAAMSLDLQQTLAELQAAYDAPASSEQLSTQLAKLKVSHVITPVLSRDIPANRFITARASPVRLIFCSSFCRPPGPYCRSIHT